MLVQLNQIIHNETSGRFFASRFCRSLYTITKEKGFVAGGAMTLATIISGIYVSVIFEGAGEGTIRSLKDTYEDQTPIVRLRPLGDAGGWGALTIISVMALERFLRQLIREGEYIRLKSICKKWIQENQSQIKRNPQLAEKLYVAINDFLQVFSAQCLFSKSLSSRRLVALKVCREFPIFDKKSALYKDRQLQDIFCQVKSEIEKTCSTKLYFYRFYKGQKSIKKGGCCKQLSSVILGVAIPLLLLSSAIFCYIGEIGLGKKLFVDREDLTDIGHFGEWPFNALEFIMIAFFLNISCIINEGDFAIIKRIYANCIQGLEDDEHYLRACLREASKEDLAQQAAKCYYSKYPLDYKIGNNREYEEREMRPS
ncbi:hypothetical protein [Candidatus Protochlamydia amoebophila]|uniref:hypothetical protein n=1 Tax=Candidatus Protochlamydia amoebophila TaxID=362787 RepID=UPI001BC9C1AC|nr:hypothetical protein [Candidatus Protochlamydia amoebophila]